MRENVIHGLNISDELFDKFGSSQLTTIRCRKTEIAKDMVQCEPIIT